MKFKSTQATPSSKRKIYEHPIDNCNHLISTSLRDLKLKYQNLRSEQGDSIDLNKTKPDLTSLDS